MSDVAIGTADQPDRGEQIAVIADQIVKAFGSDARAVVEKQIKAAEGKDALVTWTAIKAHLWPEEDRRL